MYEDAEWQILAEKAAQEKDPNKLLEIVEALSRALDDEIETQRNPSGKVPRLTEAHRLRIDS